jgi:hypothetical protein
MSPVAEQWAQLDDDAWYPLIHYQAATGKTARTARRECREQTIKGRKNGHGNWEVKGSEINAAIIARATAPLGLSKPTAVLRAEAAIRGMWYFLIPGFGIAIDMLIAVFTSWDMTVLGISVHPAIILGCSVLLGASKKRWFPDTKY